MSHFRFATEDDEVLDQRDARARRAVAEFRRMQTNLTGLAQALTKNRNVRVEVSTTSNGSTDGTRIFFRPPIELGDTYRHNPRLCDKRDENKQMRCKACDKHEQVVLPIQHEIAHIGFDTFLKPEPEDVVGLLEDAVRLSGSRYAEKLRVKIEKEDLDIVSYMQMAQLISEWMQPLVNALEDSRVDSEMFRVRPGTRVMYQALLNRVRDKGIETQDPRTGQIEYLPWSQQPLDYQAIFACYCIITKYDYSGWFVDEVNEAMQDDDLHELLTKVRSARTARQTYKQAFAILERLRELGFCKRPDDPEEDDEEDSGSDSGPTDGGDGGDGSGQSGTSGSSSGPGNPSSGSGESQPSSRSSSDTGDEKDDGNGDSGDDAGSSSKSAEGNDEADGGDSDDASEGSGDNSDGDDEADKQDGGGSDDDVQGDVPEPEPDRGEPDQFQEFIDKANGHEELKEKLRNAVLAPSGAFDTDDTDPDDKAIIVAILQALYFDEPSRWVEGVRIHSYDDLDTMRDHAWNSRYAGWHDLEVPESILGSALLRLRVALAENERRKKTVNLKAGRINGRSLGKRAPLGDDRMFQQRSTISRRKYKVVLGLDISGSTSMKDVIALIKRAVMAQANLLHRLGIDFAIYAHSGGSRTIFGSDLYLDVYVVKEFSDPWDDKIKKHLQDLTSTNANLDGHTLEYYRKMLDKTQGTDKILVYYTDGAMPLENYEEELSILLREIRMLKTRRYPHLFVGVRNDEPAEKYGLPMVRLDSDADIVKVVDALGAAVSKS